MSIDRQHGRLIFCCDVCGETAGESEANITRPRHSEQSDFHQLWNELKSEGWHACKTMRGTFEHYCPRCKE